MLKKMLSLWMNFLLSHFYLNTLRSYLNLSLYQNMPGSFAARNNPAPNESRLATKEYRI